jgi:outer membrane protein, heavy metal efflux system
MFHARRRVRCALPVLLAWLGVAPGAYGQTTFDQHGPKVAERQVSVEREVSFADLLTYANAHAPALLVASLRRGYAEAARTAAEATMRYNPSLELGIGPRFNGARDRDFDFVAALGQPVEIGGARGRRIEAAARLGDRLDAETLSVRWQLRRDLSLTFHAALVAREQVSVAERGVQFAEQMVDIARRRLIAGDATLIDVRIAETELVQARQGRLVAERDLRSARLHLAELSGWPLETPPNVPGRLTALEPVPPLVRLFQVTSDRHPELRVRRAALFEAQSRTRLADREAWPTPIVGAQVAREGSAGSPANYVLLGTLGLPLPLWQRNQGERARSRIDENVAAAEQAATEQAVRARIVRCHAELEAAAERLALFTAGVAPLLEDSLALLRRGFEAGELPLLDVALARERFLAAERDVLSAYADYYRARVELEFAVGIELPIEEKTGGKL